MEESVRKSDQWLDRKGPEEHIVVSSRARYARNLPRIPFPMRAKPEELRQVMEQVKEAVISSPTFDGGMVFNLAQIKPIERNFLKESHLISTEMEKGAENRLIIVSPDVKVAVMVNEEDHLRIFALETGLQPFEVLNRVMALENELDRQLHFAFSPKYGFLTACPTNTGTGLRISVMLHLPALALAKKLPELIKGMPQHGLTVRGFYGENSENLGDFFQISNEVTLGKSEQEIAELLSRIVEDIIEREEQARRLLFEKNALVVDDEVWRAYGLLCNARVITSQEAVQMLSKLRLGIDRGYFGRLGHSELNKLIVEVQPGHLQCASGAPVGVEARDVLRAELLRNRLAELASRN